MKDLISGQEPNDDTGPIILGSRKHRYLSNSVLLDEAIAPRHIRYTIALLAAAVVAFIAWAAIAELDTVAAGTGEIVPSGSIHVVQHQDGGGVVAILAAEGQRVKKGQPLLTLDRVEPEAQLKTATARYWALVARTERLKAQIDEVGKKQPDFSMIPGEYANFAREQGAILESQRKALDNQEAVLKSQLAQQQAELDRLKRQVEVGVQESNILREVVNIRDNLEADKLVTKVDKLETQRSFVVQGGEIDKLRLQTRVTGSVIEETQGRLKAIRTDRRRDAHEELGVAMSDLAQVSEQLAALKRRLERVDIVSPADGITQDLRFKTVGGVIPPNSQVVSVVPVEGEMRAEVRIQPADVGHIKVGMPVRVKMITYDFLRYGTVDGKIIGVSASSFVDNNGQPYFKTTIQLARNHMGNDAARFPITPGMTLAVDIITDRKTVLQYLARPVVVAFQQGMRER